jgi:hypothetical protein
MVIHSGVGQFDLWNSLNGAPFEETHAECHPSETESRFVFVCSLLLVARAAASQ